jgi:hypothetical protein
MAITLDDVVLEQMQTNETLGILVDKTNVMIELQESGFDGFISQLKELYLFMVNDAYTQNRLSRERHRELMSRQEQAPIVGGGGGDDTTPPPVDDSSTLLKAGIFSASALAVTEFVKGFSQSVRRDFARLRSRGGILGKDILKPVKDLNAAVKDLYKRRGTGQFNLKSLKTLGAQNTRRLQSFFEGIKKIEDGLSGFFKALKPQFLFDIVDDIKGAGSRMKDFFTNNRLVQGIKSIFSGTGMSRFMGALGGFFNVLGRIAYPILLAYEVITGSMKEVEEQGENASLLEKVLAGFIGAAKGVFRFVFGFFDLLKDVTSWIAEKLGFLDFAKFLDSFSFAEGAIDLIFGTADKIGKWLGGAIFDLVQWFGSIPEKIGNLWDSLPSLSDVGNALSEATKSMVRAILPPADFAKFEIPKLDTWFGTIGGGTVDLNPIPDALYEWANSPAPKRESVAPPAPAGETTATSGVTSGATSGVTSGETSGTSAEEMVDTMIRGAERPTTQERVRQARQASEDSPQENLSSPTTGSYSVEIKNPDGSRSMVQGILEAPEYDPSKDRYTNDLFDESQFQSMAPITNIIDSSVNTSNQQNVSAGGGSRPMSSPLNDNRTRASAWSGL